MDMWEAYAVIVDKNKYVLKIRCISDDNMYGQFDRMIFFNLLRIVQAQSGLPTFFTMSAPGHRRVYG